MIVRFINDCRDGISWFKGDQGEVIRALVEKPQATSDIFIVEVRGQNVWATGEDFIVWNQLSLF
jgi:hypothetical protein